MQKKRRIFACYLEHNYFFMSCILSIDTSTNVCSVAVSHDGCCVFDKEEHSGPNHAEKLGTFVDEALSFIDDNNLHLDAVAVSGGPGSYTGLRIGVSMAKVYAMVVIQSYWQYQPLELLAVPVLLHHEEIEENALIVPMIDARRMEVYAQVFDRSLKTIRPIHADIVDETLIKSTLTKGQFTSLAMELRNV